MAKEKGITLTHICKALNVSRTYLSEQKIRQKDISWDKLVIIADVLGTTPDYLAGKTNDKGLPLKKEADPNVEEMARRISKMDTKTFDTLIKYADFLIAQQEQQDAEDPSKKV
jgi:transcriptional regulator with XRE-family HTH domain